MNEKRERKWDKEIPEARAELASFVNKKGLSLTNEHKKFFKNLNVLLQDDEEEKELQFDILALLFCLQRLCPVRNMKFKPEKDDKYRRDKLAKIRKREENFLRQMSRGKMPKKGPITLEEYLDFGPFATVDMGPHQKRLSPGKSVSLSTRLIYMLHDKMKEAGYRKPEKHVRRALELFCGVDMKEASIEREVNRIRSLNQ
jgi:hypothetical protein